MFYYGSWLKLPISTRVILAKHFGIAKIGSIHVQDNVIVSDGYKVHDVESALNPGAIATYVGATAGGDFDLLWKMMVDKAEGRTNVTGTQAPTAFTTVPTDGLPPVVQPVAKKIEKVIKKQTRAITKPQKRGK